LAYIVRATYLNFLGKQGDDIHRHFKIDASSADRACELVRPIAGIRPTDPIEVVGTAPWR
jgi:hypothetical protein